MTALCSLFAVSGVLQEFAHFKVASSKREKCLSRARRCLAVWVSEGPYGGMAGPGRDRLGESASALKGLRYEAKKEAKSGLARWLGALIRSGIRDKSELAMKMSPATEEHHAGSGPWLAEFRVLYGGMAGLHGTSSQGWPGL